VGTSTSAGFDAICLRLPEGIRGLYNADVFDLERAENRHLAFAAGAHFCLGAPLARLHAEVAIPALLERFPHLSRAGEPEWLGSLPLRQLERLRVKW